MWNDHFYSIQLIIIEAAAVLSLLMIVAERVAGDFEKAVLRLLQAWATIKTALKKK